MLQSLILKKYERQSSFTCFCWILLLCAKGELETVLIKETTNTSKKKMAVGLMSQWFCNVTCGQQKISLTDVMDVCVFHFPAQKVKSNNYFICNI